METKQRQVTTVHATLQDDDARASLVRIFQQQATDDDYQRVRTYLRTTEAGRSDVLTALRSASTDRMVRRVVNTADAATLDVLSEFVGARADMVRAELQTENSTATERLVVEQAVEAWVRLEYVQQRYDGAVLDNAADAMRFWDRMLTKAQQRYLRTLESLSKIRRYELQVVERVDADGTQQRSVGIRANG